MIFTMVIIAGVVNYLFIVDFLCRAIKFSALYIHGCSSFQGFFTGEGLYSDSDSSTVSVSDSSSNPC